MLAEQVGQIVRAAREASFSLSHSSGQLRNEALREMAQALRSHSAAIIKENRVDVEEARVAGTSTAMLDRLRLDEGRVEGMASALEEVALLPDPLGREDESWTRPNGLQIGRRRIPLGVIGFIYEARPNVTSDAVGLCLKSGNAVVLKGGRLALRSNRAIIAALKEALNKVGISEAAASFIDSADRSAVMEMLKLDEWIDVIIPRGGEGLIRFVCAHARMPVIKHYKGVCHLYFDASADPTQAVEIALNSKCQRPGVCNAAETLLVHRDAVETALIPAAEALIAQGVTLHACDRTLKALGERAGVVAAVEEDWGMEYLSLEIAVKVVDNLGEAVAHIRRYGSEHTEAIITQRYSEAERFLNEVNSSTVLVNASTRFADGGELGLGAEIGISTTKLHAFGPMGLKELTTTKFVVRGQGQVRS